MDALAQLVLARVELGPALAAAPVVLEERELDQIELFSARLAVALGLLISEKKFHSGSSIQ
jgi:hypothetical protein